MPKQMERHALGIPLRHPDASPAFRAAIVQALVKNMLFMHQQIPCTYDELRNAVPPPPPPPGADVEPPPAQPGPPRRRPNMTDRKAAKLVHALEGLFAQLPAALDAAATAAASSMPDPSSAAASTVVALLLGSSPAAPRLVILVRIFPLADGVAGPADAAAAATAVRDGCLRVMRNVVTQCGSLAAVNPGLCRMHLLVQAQPSAALDASHFQPRPGLTLKLKRAHAVCLGVGGPAGGCAVPDVVPEQLRASDWCAAAIDGLVPPAPRARRRRGGVGADEEAAADEHDDAAMMDEEHEQGDDVHVNGDGHALSGAMPNGGARPDGGGAAPTPMDVADGGGEPEATHEAIWFQSTATLQAFRTSSSRANGM